MDPKVVAPSSDQEYWDACLIKTWREDQKVWHLITMFEAITNKNVFDCKLKRAPWPQFPRSYRVRVFVARQLPKLNDKLWNNPSEKDVSLFKTLTKSNYNIIGRGGGHMSESDKELAAAQRLIKKNELRGAFNTLKYKERNHDTDWKVVK